MSSNSLSPSSVLEQMNTVFQADPTSPMQHSHGAATCAVFTSAVQVVRRVAPWCGTGRAPSCDYMPASS